MDRDKLSAGLVLLTLITLIGGIVMYFHLNDRLENLTENLEKKNKELASLKGKVAQSDQKLAVRLNEIEQLNSRIGIMGECLDGAFEALKVINPEGKTLVAYDRSTPIQEALIANSKGNSRVLVTLLTVLEPCNRYFLTIRSKIQESSSLDIKEPISH